MERRVVITGLGMLSPLGNTVAENWGNVRAGKSGIGPITLFDASRLSTQFGGEVKGFDPGSVMDPKEVKRYERFIHLAVGAASEAISDSDLVFEGELAERTGVVLGTGMGGLNAIEEMRMVLHEKGPRRVSPFFIPSCIINMAPGLVSMKYGLLGPNYSTVSACASAGHALLDAYHFISRGEADVMVTGGAESVMTELAFAGFNSAKALSTRNENPQAASRPWDQDRDGFVMGEGAGVLILEELEHALARGAKIYAEVLGGGMSADAHHITAPHPEGRGAILAMKGALRSGRIDPSEVGYINAHGTSTGLGDVAETEAIKKVFGEHAYKLSVSSTKSMTGHLLGAAGGIEAIYSVLALKHQVLPPTINLENVDQACDLDYVPNQSREVSGLKVALSNSFGFGGTNVTLAFRRYE
jgi:3-oxoacyl-[acyl-carrier-protein] synthase II